MACAGLRDPPWEISLSGACDRHTPSVTSLRLNLVSYTASHPFGGRLCNVQDRPSDRTSVQNVWDGLTDVFSRVRRPVGSS